jgi:mutator protein MutT
MKARLRTVGCFIEHEGKFIILHRNENKTYGNEWGLPAGKLDSDETDTQAIVRECFEETGIQIDPKNLELLGVYEFNFVHLDLIFPTFRVMLEKKPKVKINPSEHQGYKWVSAEECYEMPNLIEGLQDLLMRVGYIKNG